MRDELRAEAGTEQPSEGFDAGRGLLGTLLLIDDGSGVSALIKGKLGQMERRLRTR